MAEEMITMYFENYIKRNKYTKEALFLSKLPLVAQNISVDFATLYSNDAQKLSFSEKIEMKHQMWTLAILMRELERIQYFIEVFNRFKEALDVK